MKKHMDDTEEKEEGRRAFGKLFHRENEEKPWDNEPIDDIEEEDWPLVEYEDLEIEEDGDSETHGGILKPLLIGIVVLALLVVAFFVVRNVIKTHTGKNEASMVVVPTEMPPEDEKDNKQDNGIVVEENNGTEDDDLKDETIPLPAVGGASSALTEPVESTVPTPTPTPEVPAIPEKYLIPDVDAGDLSAVRDYIQSQLDAIAADLYCPNIDEITMNEDCTVFTVICNSIEESVAEQEAVEKIYNYGRTYAAYAGTTPGKIRIEYKNHVGDMLWVRESAS